MAGILHLMLYLTPVKVPPPSSKVMPVATLVRHDTSDNFCPKKVHFHLLEILQRHTSTIVYILQKGCQAFWRGFAS